MKFQTKVESKLDEIRSSESRKYRKLANKGLRVSRSSTDVSHPSQPHHAAKRSQTRTTRAHKYCHESIFEKRKNHVRAYKGAHDSKPRAKSTSITNRLYKEGLARQAKMSEIQQAGAQSFERDDEASKMSLLRNNQILANKIALNSKFVFDQLVQCRVNK